MPLPTPNKGEKQDAFISRCMSNDTMKSDFEDHEQRLAVCFSQFGKKANMRDNLLTINSDIGLVRRETFMGEEHLVVPVIALVEKVMRPANSPDAELALAEEFAPSTAGWNGRPVVVNHPEINGVKVSANSPQVLETELIGHLFNSKFEDNKLKFEAWINLSRVNSVGGDAPDLITKLENEDPVEVSTGLFADVENQSGDFKGEHFNGIWRNIIPDHLALLSEGKIGACSIEDGCGAPRVNERSCSCGSNCGGKCMEIREKARKPAFNGTSLDTINIPNSVEEAIAFYNKFGKPAEDIETYALDDLPLEVRVWLSEHSLLGNEKANSFEDLIHTSVVDFKSGKLNKEALLAASGDERCTFAANTLLLNEFLQPTTKSMWDKVRAIFSSEMSDQDRRMAIQSALDADKNEFSWVLAVFSDTFVYETWDGLFQNSYTISEDGVVALGGEPTPVRPETSFVPVKVETSEDGKPPSTLEGKDMEKSKFVKDLISNERTRFSADDEEFLMSLEEGQLEKLAPVEVQEQVEDDPPVEPETPTANETEMTVEEYLKKAPKPIRDNLQAGLNREKQHRADLIKSIKDNENNSFTEEYLGALDTMTLEGIARFCEKTDNTGRGGPRTVTASQTDGVPAMPKAFEIGPQKKTA